MTVGQNIARSLSPSLSLSHTAKALVAHLMSSVHDEVDVVIACQAGEVFIWGLFQTFRISDLK